MRLPLALKLGSTVLAVVTGMFVAAGLLASALTTGEIRALLQHEIIPEAETTLSDTSDLFAALLDEEREQARSQAREWFDLNGQNLARSLLGETFPLAEGYDFDGIEALLTKRVRANDLLEGASAYVGASGEDHIRVGPPAPEGTQTFSAEREHEFTRVRVEIQVRTDPLTTAFTQMEETVAGALAEVGRQREASKEQLATRSIEASRQASKRLAGYLVTAGIAALALTAGILWWIITRWVTYPLGTFARAAQATAEGNLNLKLRVHRDDEIGTLADSFREMTTSLRTIVAGLRTTTDELSDTAQKAAAASKRTHRAVDIQNGAVETVRTTTARMDQAIAAVVSTTDGLTMGAGQAAAAVEEMTVSISSVAEVTQGHAKAADDATSRVEQMTHALSGIASHLQGVTATSQEISATLYQISETVRRIEEEAHTSAQATAAASKEASERGMPAVRDAVEGMVQIQDTMDHLDTVIRRLTSRSRDIGKIVTVIDEVAGQTKLLALNAAILAAQAGSHGGGFSIVANQIRGLAERTAKATREIAGLISSVQEETRATADTTQLGLAAVKDGRARITQVEAAFASITERTETAANLSESIREATTEEAVAVDQITLALRSMSDEMDSIARTTTEQDQSNQAVLELMRDIRTGADEVVRATAGQMAASHEISQAATQVANNAREIGEQIQDQKEQSAAIVASVDEVSTTISELVGSATGMEDTVRDLEGHVRAVRAEISNFRLGDDPADGG